MGLKHDIRFCTTSDGVRIAYATYGSGYPLVWVPGWISHLEIDEFLTGGFIEQWARFLRVVRYDKRGTGLSDRHQADMSVEARTRDLEAVVDALALERFVLNGISEGGPIALNYAAKHPERVSHLVMYGSYAYGGFGRSDASEALLALVRAQWGLATSAFTSMLLPDATAEEMRQFARLQTEGAHVDDAVRLIEAVGAIDVRPVLPNITAPTLVIHGKHDRAVPMAAGRELAASIPNARFLTFDGGHGVTGNPSAAHQVVEAMREFMSDVMHPQAPSDAGDSGTRRSGLATILFTDIVGHTEMMQRLGDARGRDVLREHERVTREVLKQHGGAEVKTMGDGFMASFGSVTRAMECAVALQRAFAAWHDERAERGGHAGPPLQIRVGLNAGEPIVEEGDLFGSTVILASRVCAQAGAGEILIPEPVRHLLSGKGFVFADRGEFAPKGFDDAVRLYEVRWRE
jgi:class 3 adenylate cyclase/pimeloyl-ACP methyl ester carboxylesterase